MTPGDSVRPGCGLSSSVPLWSGRGYAQEVRPSKASIQEWEPCVRAVTLSEGGSLAWRIGVPVRACPRGVLVVEGATSENNQWRLPVTRGQILASARVAQLLPTKPGDQSYDRAAAQDGEHSPRRLGAVWPADDRPPLEERPARRPCSKPAKGAVQERTSPAPRRWRR